MGFLSWLISFAAGPLVAWPGREAVIGEWTRPGHRGRSFWILIMQERGEREDGQMREG